jgi:hypothetical protein
MAEHLTEKKGGRIWGMHGYSAEPIRFREEEESFINITPVLSFFVTVASRLERGKAASTWIPKTRRSLLYA